MSIIGTYYCTETNSTFIIENANDSNGKATGSIEINGVKIPVNIHYHIKNNDKSTTNLWLAGNLDDPNKYVGGAGKSDSNSYQTINIAGGYPTGVSVETFEGTYHRK